MCDLFVKSANRDAIPVRLNLNELREYNNNATVMNLER